MAKTLITTPYPTPAELAKILGLSAQRVRELDAMMESIWAKDKLAADRKKKSKARAKKSK